MIIEFYEDISVWPSRNVISSKSSRQGFLEYVILETDTWKDTAEWSFLTGFIQASIVTLKSLLVEVILQIFYNFLETWIFGGVWTDDIPDSSTFKSFTPDVQATLIGQVFLAIVLGFSYKSQLATAHQLGNFHPTLWDIFLLLVFPNW